MITTSVNILSFLLAKFFAKNLKLLNLKIEGFQSPKGREKTRKKSQKNYVWFSVM
jgi:hypothetical protein